MPPQVTSVTSICHLSHLNMPPQCATSVTSICHLSHLNVPPQSPQSPQCATSVTSSHLKSPESPQCATTICTDPALLYRMYAHFVTRSCRRSSFDTLHYSSFTSYYFWKNKYSPIVCRRCIMGRSPSRVIRP